MSTTMLMTAAEIQAEGGREKWLELRTTGIGGSDAGIIVGVNTYKSKFQLWQEKTSQTVASEINLSDEVKERMEWGNRLEEPLAQWFQDKTGKKLRRCGMVRSDENPFMIADVDRLVVGENAIVEIKTTAGYNYDEWADDKVPPSYLVQALHYMAVGNYDKCYFVCLCGGQRAVIREFERDDDEINALIEAEKDFWENYVVPHKIPEVDYSDSCTKTIEKMYPGGNKEPMPLSGEWEQQCEQIKQLEAQITEIKKVIDEKKNKLRLELGNSEKGECGDYIVSYGIHNRAVWDNKAFAEDYPELSQKYRRQTQYRMLTVNLTRQAKKRRAKEVEDE